MVIKETEAIHNPYAEMVRGYKDQILHQQLLAQFQLEQDLSMITNGFEIPWTDVI
ncbi:MAG: hypothetical protein QM800_04415 [Paludibacter sp.]